MADERIFISYSTKDGKAFADVLRQELKTKGFSVWQDLVALKGGQDWWSQIETALKSKALQHFILVVTPGALASTVVRQEIRLARQEGKTVSPVRGPGFDDLNELPRWIGQVYDLKVPEKHELLMQVLQGPSYQNRVPMMAPEPPADFVQRTHEFGALKAKLLDAKGDIATHRDGKGDTVAITAALRGAGGYGKTTLAKALAHDPDIQAAYFDGILWAVLGESPENLLTIISDLITRLTGTPPGLGTVNAAASALGEALGDRRILLCIDDAWREQDLRPFLQGGRNTTRLITTRLGRVVPQDAQKQQVDAMRGDEALKLLSWGVPEKQVAPQTQALVSLAARLGEWAQLLKLVNGFLRDRVCECGEPLAIAIVDANERLDGEGLTSFDATDENDRTKAVALTINLSLGLLDAAQRARFKELAVFPEDVDVPVGIAARLWQETAKFGPGKTKDLLLRFYSLSLLLSLDLDRRTFRFHDTVRHFLQEQAGKDALAALHKRLLKALDGIDADANADEASRRYYFLHRPAHLAEAGERAGLDALLLDPGWLKAKLEATGSPQALVADYDQFGQGEVQDLIGRTLRLTSGICARDKRQLLPQLHGRLMAQSAATAFCSAARRLVAPAILCCRASLTPPGAEVMRLEGHKGAVVALAVLPDGRLASGSHDGTIRLWNLETGQETASLEGHSHWVNTLAVLPDGRLASGSSDTIRLWDTKTAEQLAKLEGYSASNNAMAVLPDGRLAWDSSGIIWLWDAKKGEQPARLEGDAHCYNVLSTLPNGDLASDHHDRTIRLWDSKTGQELTRLKGHRMDTVSALAVLPDGRLASGSFDNIILWDPKTGKEAWLKGHGHAVRVDALAVLPDGRLASGSTDDTVRLWDTKTGAELARLEGHAGCVRALAVLPDGRLASGSEDYTIRLWDAKTSEQLPRPKGHSRSINALAVLPDGRIASGSSDKTIRLWDTETGEQLARFEGHFGSVRALAVLPDDRIASLSHDGTIRLWDTKTGKETASLDGNGEVLAALPDGRLAWGVNSKSVCDVKTGKETASLEGPLYNRVAALAVLPDGRLASSYSGQTILLWDPNTGREAARLEGHADWVGALAVLPDGRLASGSNDGTIRLWDPDSGRELARLEGHADRVYALAALPDGRLAFSSAHHTIRLWDPNSGPELARLEVDFAVVCIVTLGGNRLAAGDAGGRIHWLEIIE